MSKMRRLISAGTVNYDIYKLYRLHYRSIVIILLLIIIFLLIYIISSFRRDRLLIERLCRDDQLEFIGL